MSHWLALVVALTMAMPLAGQQTAQGYRLGSGDLLSVSVLEAPEMSTNQAIGEDGTLTLAGAVGRVMIAGLTVDEAEEAIERRLLRELRSATVTIAVNETRASSVRLLGAVNSPGTRTIRPTTTLFELLTREDVVQSENAGVVKVRRVSHNGLFEVVEIPLAPLLQGIEPRYYLPLANGDLITVPPAEQLTVHFTGELAGEITFSSAEPKTLIRAISKAGGMTDRSSGRILINRTNPDGTTSILEANYKRMIRGREPDIVLQPGDLIHVKRSII